VQSSQQQQQQQQQYQQQLQQLTLSRLSPQQMQQLHALPVEQRAMQFGSYMRETQLQLQQQQHMQQQVGCAPAHTSCIFLLRHVKRKSLRCALSTCAEDLQKLQAGFVGATCIATCWHVDD